MTKGIRNLSTSTGPHTTTSNPKFSDDTEVREDGLDRISSSSSDTIYYNGIDEEKQKSNFTQHAVRYESGPGEHERSVILRERSDFLSAIVTDNISSSLKAGNVAKCGDEIPDESVYVIQGEQTPFRDMPLVLQPQKPTPCMDKDGYNVPDFEIESLNRALAARTGMPGFYRGRHSYVAETQGHQGTAKAEGVPCQLQGIGIHAAPRTNNTKPGQWSHSSGVRFPDHDQGNDTRNGSNEDPVDDSDYLIPYAEGESAHEGEGCKNGTSQVDNIVHLPLTENYYDDTVAMI